VADGLDQVAAGGAVIGFGVRRVAGCQVPLDAIAFTARDYGAAGPYDRAPQDALGGGGGAWRRGGLSGLFAAGVRGRFDRSCSHGECRCTAFRVQKESSRAAGPNRSGQKIAPAVSIRLDTHRHGRRVSVLPQRHALAIDVGGTKLAAGVVDSDGGLFGAERIATPAAATADDLFKVLEALARRAVQTANVDIVAVGVGCGGPMRYPSGVVSPLNIPIWRDGFPLRQRLMTAFDRPCVVDNDAKALALGERWRGAGRGSNNMLGMVVSTGVGGGVILDGRLLHGAAGNAGHIGHVIVWPGGPVCGCGALGCVEGVSSGTGLARRLSEAMAAGEQTRLAPGSTAADIATAARHGDALAIELFRTAGEGVGRGIASTAALFDLELVVIGGSIALRAWDLLGPPLEATLRASARLDFTRGVRVVHAELGDTAGLFGAAQLAFDSVEP
jgi:glucokinase